jgi:hypothetical protein
MSAQSALNIFLGGRKVMFDKRTILPNCQAPTCIIDEGTQVEPPILQNGWVTNIDGSNDTTAQSVTVDKINGNFIYVTGNFTAQNSTGVDALDVRNHDNVTAGIINTSSFGFIDVPPFTISDTFVLEYIAKYDTNGDAVWATYMKMNNGDSSTKARSIKTDSIGDVYVTLDVFFSGGPQTNDIDFYDFVNVTAGTINTSPQPVGTLTLLNSQSLDSDIILIKYNSTGQLQWVTSIGNIANNPGGETEFESSLTIDSSDNIYVSGTFRNNTLINSADPLTPTITLTPYATLQPPGATPLNNIGFIAKYDVNGLAQGATAIGGGGGNGGHRTTVTCIDSDGTDIFVSGISFRGGSSTSTTLQFYDFTPPLTINIFPIPASINLTATGTLQDFTNTQPFLAKYNANLEFQWGLRVDGTSNNQGQVASVSASSDGVCITGFYSTPSLASYNILSTGPTPITVGILPPNGPLAGFIIKYKKLNGDLLWATTFAGTTQISRGYSLATDSFNNVIVTGESTDPSMTVNSYNGIDSGLNILLAPFGTLSTSGPVRKIFIIKYEGFSGQVQWATYLDENPSTSVLTTPTSFSISTDSADDIIICGKYSEPLVFRSYQTTVPSTNPINTIVYGTLPIIDEQGSTAYLAKYKKTGVVV